MSNYTVVFEPIGRKGECWDDESILECARELGIGISSICGGKGTCGTCRIQLTGGKLSAPTPAEFKVFSSKELDDGWRLACQSVPESDCQIVIPPESLSASERIYLDGMETAISLDSPVKGYHIEMTPPSLTDQQSDASRVLAALKKQHGISCTRVDNEVLHTISPHLRQWKWRCRVSVRGDEIVAISSGKDRQLGLAVDLGTTTIAVYLVDLDTGETIASSGIMNPQIGYGEDIISRIEYAVKNPREAGKFRKLVVGELNKLIKRLCKESGASPASILEVVVVGNTAMHHLLLTLPVRQLVLTPFTAAVSMALDIKARDLGLKIAPGAYVYFPPVITGFVGADHVAVLQAIDHRRDGGLTIALDIGTNTEISLINGDEITSTSCASGPAFEGGHIKQGMRAAKGAIERIRVTDGEVIYQTIDEAPPIGICGSGVLDALAQMYLAGVIDDGGRFAEKFPGVRVEGKTPEFVLAEREDENGKIRIAMDQKDVRELQLAKAAIRSGIQLLLEKNGFTEEDIDRIIVAGAFGTYIDLSSAMTVGLLPSLPTDTFKQIGNAAGIGAKMNLLSLSHRKEARDIVSRAKYIELASTAEFKTAFIETGYLGKYRINNGKREPLD